MKIFDRDYYRALKVRHPTGMVPFILATHPAAVMIVSVLAGFLFAEVMKRILL